MNRSNSSGYSNSSRDRSLNLSPRRLCNVKSNRPRLNSLSCLNCGSSDYLMAKFPHNKNSSTIKTNLVHTGIYKDFSSLFASTIVSSIKYNVQSPPACNSYIVIDNVQRSTPKRMINMKDDVCHKAEETVVTNFLQISPDDSEDSLTWDVSPKNCNHMRIGTFETENDEPLVLYADTGAPKSVIGKKQMKRILE